MDKHVYYILMPRGFANEADVICTEQSKEEELKTWLNDNYGSNPNAQYRRITLTEAKKYEKYYYDFADYQEFKPIMNVDPTGKRIYFNPNQNH